MKEFSLKELFLLYSSEKKETCDNKNNSFTVIIQAAKLSQKSSRLLLFILYIFNQRGRNVFVTWILKEFL